MSTATRSAMPAATHSMAITARREHFDVVESPFGSGTTLVEASAGTGKTFSIAMSVIRLLLETDAQGTPLVDRLGNILVVTFTKAATDELISRVRDVLRHAHEVYNGLPTTAKIATQQLLLQLANRRDMTVVKERVACALAEVDTLAVYTIHSFCKRVLDEFALESGTAFGAALLEDDAELVQGAMQDWWRRRFYTDDALASFAVGKSWSPDTFVKDYRLWRRFPGVVISPDVTFDAARVAVSDQIAGFAAHWDEEAFRAFVGAVDWKKDAACTAGEPIEGLVRQAHAAAQGDLGAACTAAKALCVKGLLDKAMKVSKVQKAKRVEIEQWPLAVAATGLHDAITQLEQALRVDCLHHARAWTDAEKRRRNVLGFDDLLEALHRVLTAQGPHGLLATAIRQQFHAALIDEFQDTDLFQFGIFNTAFQGRPLFLIGDPKQAIYAFRGADVHAYLAAVRTADPQFTLATNYRSTTAMVEAVNAIFSRRTQAFVDDAIRFEPASAEAKAGAPALLEGSHSLHWLFVGPEDRKGKRTVTAISTARRLLFAACVRHIAVQLEAGWSPGSIAVLVRDRNEAMEVAEALRAHRIPAVVSGLGNVLGSEELLELQLVLEAIASPRHEARVRAALGTHLWGSDAVEVLSLSQAGSEAQWDTVLTQLTALREVWLHHGFLQVVQEVMIVRNVMERFMAFTDGERRLTNLRHVIELLHGAAVKGAFNIEGVLRHIRSQRANTGREGEVNELRLETDAQAVQVLTIHKSKGLQFDLVYCPTLYSARPVDASEPLLVHEGTRVVFDHATPASAERVQQAEVERLAEDCRLAYVALTRARYRTYAGWGAVGTTTGKARGAWNCALAYLLAEDPSLDAAAGTDRPGHVAQLFQNNCELYEQVLRSLVEEHPALMHLEVLDGVVPGPSVKTRAGDDAPAYAARALPADVPVRVRFDTYTISSFTHLAAGSHTAVPEVARDVDDVRAPVLTVHDLPPSDFRSFPAGRRAGTVLHSLFEHTRFADGDQLLRERVAVQLVRSGLATDEADARIDATVSMMRAVFDTPLAPWPVTLANVVQDRARHEWQFLLPFADAANAWTRQAIARAFEQHGGADGQRYADTLRQLGTARVHGFLTGFVDLVFEHRGQWYVVDWKSNQLGVDPQAYRREALQSAMESHHYTLQYHLYLVALHRHLAVRVPGYDYDRHIGGAAYAFLRGFAEGPSADGRGWYTDRPSRALIEALSAVMDGAPVAEGA
jgi:exodeoxyribonuclease V beta subunit